MGGERERERSIDRVRGGWGMQEEMRCGKFKRNEQRSMKGSEGLEVGTNQITEFISLALKQSHSLPLLIHHLPFPRPCWQAGTCVWHRVLSEWTTWEMKVTTRQSAHSQKCWWDTGATSTIDQPTGCAECQYLIRAALLSVCWVTSVHIFILVDLMNYCKRDELHFVRLLCVWQPPVLIRVNRWWYK